MSPHAQELWAKTVTFWTDEVAPFVRLLADLCPALEMHAQMASFVPRSFPSPIPGQARSPMHPMGDMGGLQDPTQGNTSSAAVRGVGSESGDVCLGRERHDSGRRAGESEDLGEPVISSMEWEEGEAAAVLGRTRSGRVDVSGGERP